LKLKTTILVSVGEERNYFDYFRLTMEDEGLRIEAKSPLFAAWLKSITSGFYQTKTSNPWHMGKEKYLALTQQLPPNSLSHLGWVFLDEYWFFQEGKPNLFWLTHKDLGEGFSILVKQPISLNDFQDYFEQCSTAIRELYVHLLRKASAEATFSELWAPAEPPKQEEVPF
jgi:hypothetical protein